LVNLLCAHERYPSLSSPLVLLTRLIILILPFPSGLVKVYTRIFVELAKDWCAVRHLDLFLRKEVPAKRENMVLPLVVLTDYVTNAGFLGRRRIN